MHPHTQTHMHLHKQHSATTYIYTCIPTCIYTCALTYKNTQKLRWQPIVQVFKRIKYVYSEINFYFMSHSFTLSVKWLSNASEATNGSSITMGKEQNLHGGNEDLVLLMRLLLSLNLKFLKLKLEKKMLSTAAAAHWVPVARGGMSVSVTLVQTENIREKMYQACPPGNQDPESMLKLIPGACFSAQATNAHWTSFLAVSDYWAFIANCLEDFAYMVSFIWNPLLECPDQSLGVI